MTLRRIGRDRLNFMPHFVRKQKSALISCRLNFMSPCFHVALISCFKVAQIYSVDNFLELVLYIGSYKDPAGIMYTSKSKVQTTQIFFKFCVNTDCVTLPIPAFTIIYLMLNVQLECKYA